MKMPLYSLLGVADPFDPTSRYTTSWLLSPYLLAASRLLISIYAFTTLFTIFGWNGSHALIINSLRSFSYFTNLTYWGIAFYFLISSIHTFSYARTGISYLQRWPRPLQALHTIYHTTIIVFPLIVTIVFWVIIYRPPFFPIQFEAWQNISQHGLNSLFCLFEILIPRTTPPPITHLPALILLLALYLCVAYITYATQGFYTYSFLNPSHGVGALVGYIAGITVGACVIFGLVWGIVWLRRIVTERVWGMEGKFWVGARKEVFDAEMGSLVK